MSKSFKNIQKQINQDSQYWRKKVSNNNEEKILRNSTWDKNVKKEIEPNENQNYENHLSYKAQMVLDPDEKQKLSSKLRAIIGRYDTQNNEAVKDWRTRIMDNPQVQTNYGCSR